MKPLSVLELMELFGTDKAAEDWFIQTRWPDGVRCARCSGTRAEESKSHPTQRFYCRDCKKVYSVKPNSVMEASNIGYQKWAIAIYLFVTRPKGISSLQLHKDLGVTQKTAWFMEHRIREALDTDTGLFEGPVEVDETFVGGRARNQTWARKKWLRKEIVIGMYDRATNKIKMEHIDKRDTETLQEFVIRNTTEDAVVYTDEARQYEGVMRKHLTVNHSAHEYGLTNGMESCWAILKRAYKGTYHKMSAKHLHRYSTELQERHNRRPLSAIDRMKSVVVDGAGKRLRYADLTGGEKVETTPVVERVPQIQAVMLPLGKA